MTYQQIKAIEEKNKQRILSVNPKVTEQSGIYVLRRFDGGFKYAYIGQAKHLLTRLAQHLNGYQHIDLSIKKHGLASPFNPTGWHIDFIITNNLDEMERQKIQEYANKGYQLRNKTLGGQNEGKLGIADNRPTKGYYDGIRQGEKNVIKQIRHLFDLHLNAVVKSDKPNKNQEKALQKFKDLLEG